MRRFSVSIVCLMAFILTIAFFAFDANASPGKANKADSFQESQREIEGLIQYQLIQSVEVSETPRIQSSPLTSVICGKEVGNICIVATANSHSFALTLFLPTTSVLSDSPLYTRNAKEGHYSSTRHYQIE